MNSPLSFWALALALIVVTLAVVLWPLVRRRAVDAPSDDTARTAIYRDQKRQLDEELAAGTLSERDHAAALSELTRRLALELDAPAATAPSAPERGAWIAALAAVAIIPVGAILLYLAVGTPDALRATAIFHERPTDEQIVAMVERLAAKMKAEPGDPKGWRLLGRSYAALGRYAESADAFAQAVQRGGAEDPDLLTDWAESLAIAHGRTVSGEPEQLAQRALAKDPTHPRALALLATAAFERRDFDKSLEYWKRLQARLPPGGEDAAQAAAAIAEVTRVRDQGSLAKAPSAPAANAGSGSVAGTIDIAPALAARVAAGDTLFVFARASGGPRMPLAVWRTQAAALPRAFTLDDSMGMAGGSKLSDAPAVIVEARISRSGDATPRPGDLVGRSGDVKPGTKDVRIVIDQAIP